MKERLKKLRKALGLTQQEFADRLGISRGSIGTYESRDGNPGSSVITLICREFSVSETWLRTGEGEMFVRKNRNEEIAAFVNGILQGEPDFRQKFISVLSRMTMDEWAILEKKVLELAGELQPENKKQEKAPENPVVESNVAAILFPYFCHPSSAGTGQPVESELPEHISLKKMPPNGTSYITRVSGDSMEPTYCDGDLIFVSGLPEIRQGQVGIFFMDGQQWVKELGDGVLVSHNPKYPPRPLTEDAQCQGLVLGVCDKSYLEE